MRCAKSFALLALAAPLMIAAPAWARVSPEWTKALAEVQALPPDGSPPPEVLAEVRQKITPAANAPKSFAIVGLDVSGNFSEETWSRRPDGLWDAAVTSNVEQHHVLDPLGILDLHNGKQGAGTVATLTISAPLRLDGTISAAVVEHVLQRWDDDVWVNDKSLALQSGAPRELTVSDTYTLRLVFSDGEHTGPKSETGGQKLLFDPRFGVFFDRDLIVTDWRFDEGSWRSQQVSAALSPAQRQQARGFFARGFDLYKAGDLEGAKALILGGLKIDPGNHLGWFALGELGRSYLVNMNKYDVDRYWPETALRVGYRHAIDLAPSSPEALLAKGRLDAAPKDTGVTGRAWRQ